MNLSEKILASGGHETILRTAAGGDVQAHLCRRTRKHNTPKAVGFRFQVATE